MKVPENTDRVLVLAPTGRDAGAAAHQLGAAGFLHVDMCRDVTALVANLEEGAGVAVIAEEALRTNFALLSAWVAQQPSWSDFPFVVLTSQHIYPREDVRRVQLLKSLGNVSILERPLSSVSLAERGRIRRARKAAPVCNAHDAGGSESGRGTASSFYPARSGGASHARS